MKPIIGQKMFVVPRDRRDIAVENRIDGLYVEGEVVKVGTKYFDVKARYVYVDYSNAVCDGYSTYTFIVKKDSDRYIEAKTNGSKARAYSDRDVLVETHVTRPKLVEQIRAAFSGYHDMESIPVHDLQAIAEILSKSVKLP